MVSDNGSPIAPANRIDSIDILRGLALFGVLTVNLVTEFRVSIFQQFLGPLARTPLDRHLESLIGIFVNFKAITIFSMLFGVGLAIQFEHLRSHESPLKFLIRRLLVLLVFGLIHLCLIWNGDILTTYAAIGFLVLPFLYVSRRGLAWAFWVLVAASVALHSVPGWIAFPDSAWMSTHVVAATEAYSQGGYGEYLSFSHSELPAMALLLASIAPRTAALFLLGIFIWRKGIVQRASEHRALLKTFAMAGIAIGLALQISVPRHDLLLGRVFDIVQALFEDGAPMALALGYSAAVIYAVNFTSARRLLAWAAPVGKMAFTNYILQSLVLGWIYFGYGLGQFGKQNIGQSMAVGMALFVAQVFFSRWWLSRFRFGPIEWLWRSLMYGRAQRMVTPAPLSLDLRR